MPTNDLQHLLARLLTLTSAGKKEKLAKRGLLPLHHSILDYLTRANRYSDSPIGVAKFLGITKGTISQSILLLRRSGWLKEKVDFKDRRRVHLKLTAKATRCLRSIRASNHPESLLGLESVKLKRAEEMLRKLLKEIQLRAKHKTFGICNTCRHFLKEKNSSYRCGLTLEPLSVADSKKICREHLVKPSSLLACSQ